MGLPKISKTHNFRNCIEMTKISTAKNSQAEQVGEVLLLKPRNNSFGVGDGKEAVN